MAEITDEQRRLTAKHADVIRTFPGVEGGLWLDIVRDGPGEYSVHAIGNDTNPIAYGFSLPKQAEEWVVELQDQHRAHFKAAKQAAAGQALLDKAMGK